MLARVYNITPPPGVALDPYSDDNQAPFYRQPAGIRKKKRSEEKEEAGMCSCNILKEDLLYHFVPPDPVSFTIILTLKITLCSMNEALIDRA